MTASVTDIDGTVSNLSWRWARGDSATGSFTNISGGTSANYTTVAADVTKYLRATASYTDPQGPSKTASLVTGQIGASNSEPAFSAGTATRTVTENSAAGTNVGSAVATTDSNRQRHADLLADRYELLVIHHQHGHRPDPDQVRGHVTTSRARRASA